MERLSRLEASTYLWIRTWDSERDLGLYGCPVSLVAVRATSIKLAYAVLPNESLNHKKVRESTLTNRREYGVEPVDP